MVVSSKPPFILELERMFHTLNQEFFRGRLRTPPILVQIEKKVVFRFVPESCHLIVGAKFASASISKIVLDFFHEMVHIYNSGREVSDCTSNQYHNKNFLDVALRIGLYVARHKTQGWGVTMLEVGGNKKSVRVPTSNALIRRNRVLEKLNLHPKILERGRSEIRKAIQTRGKRKVCFLKYECGCPPPHNSIRSGRRPDGSHPLKAECMVCGQSFTCVEGQ
jgi:hypothetical protein